MDELAYSCCNLSKNLFVKGAPDYPAITRANRHFEWIDTSNSGKYHRVIARYNEDFFSNGAVTYLCRELASLKKNITESVVKRIISAMGRSYLCKEVA